MSNKLKFAHLEIKQGQPLQVKVRMTENTIMEWVDHYGIDGVYTSISGGKDSTVLHHLVKGVDKRIPSYFIDTGLEYPEVREMAIKQADKVFKPKITFREVLAQRGYPVVSKENSQKIREAIETNSPKLRGTRLGTGPHAIPKKWRFLLNSTFKISERCCDELKKKPAKRIETETGRHPFLGTMVEDSALRKQSYIKNGCNGFNMTRPRSMPMAFWTTKDVWEYIHENHLEYSTVYDKGYERTGCMFCMFGVHMEKGTNRFQRMAITHPKQYKYCIENLGLGDILSFLGIKFLPEEEKS